jgi:PST family polysaccharide transporter
MNRAAPALPDKEAGEPADGHDTSGRAFFGSIALSVVNACRLALQVAMVPIIARLLGPGAVGLVSLAMPFIFFANLLSDAGMGTALIRVPQPSRQVEATVFWQSTGLGLVIATALCVFAPAASAIFGQPDLARVLMALSPILIISSSLSVANSRISRARRFAMFAVGDLISLVASSIVAILAARAGMGAWSLVAQQLTLWVAKAAWILPISRFRPILFCRPAHVMDLLGFGLNNVGANIADLMGKSAPALIIGGQLGVIAVGRYAMALQLIRAPDLVLSGPLFLATFTAVAGHVARGAAPTQMSLRTLRLIVTALAPLFLGLATVADLVVGLFLGPKWAGAGPVLAVLAPAGFFLCVYTVAAAVLMGLGRPDLQFRLSLLCGFAILAGSAIGARFGVAAAAAGVTAGAASVSPLYAATLGRQLGVGWRALAKTLAWPLAASVMMVAAVLSARAAMSGAPSAVQFGCSIIVGAAVYLLAIGLAGRRQVLDDLRQTLPRKAVLTPDASSAGTML